MLTSGRYPSRNPENNLADLRAMLAANEKGVAELGGLVDEFGLDVVHAYMGHVRQNAEEAVRRVISALRDGSYRYELDSGAVIEVAVTVDHEARAAHIDFTGTSSSSRTTPMRPHRWRWPRSFTCSGHWSTTTSAQRRLPPADRGDDPGGLHARTAPRSSCGRQRRDVAGGDRSAVRRTGRPGRGSGR